MISPNGKLRISLSDFNDLFFEIVQPQILSYSYRIALAKNFGSSFTNNFKNVQMIFTEPFDACDKIENFKEVRNGVAFITRGYIYIHTYICDKIYLFL